MIEYARQRSRSSAGEYRYATILYTDPPGTALAFSNQYWSLQGIAIQESARLDTVVQRFNITHGVNLLLANFVVRQAFRPVGPSARFFLTGRVGVGFTVPHPENEILGVTPPEHYQVGRPAWQAGVGGEVRLWRRLYAGAEVKYTRTRQSVDIAGGRAESLLQSTHGVAGFVWHL